MPDNSVNPNTFPQQVILGWQGSSVEPMIHAYRLAACEAGERALHSRCSKGGTTPLGGAGENEFQQLDVCAVAVLLPPYPQSADRNRRVSSKNWRPE